jgi:hypothetical protein
MVDRYPLEDKIQGKDEVYIPSLLFKHRNYIDILPAFIKAVNFTNSNQVRTCYEFLETSEKAKNMKPEEALALLGSQFGDERIRIFAL